MATHASTPVALPLGGTRVRVFFSSRDAGRRSHVGFVEIDLEEPSRILRLCAAPALAPGEAGLFDDSGVSTGCLVRDDSEIRLYYVGWNLGVTVPFRNAIGVATSLDGETFTRRGRAPLLDRDETDPFSLSYPWVLRDGARWRLWYGTNLSWGAGRPEDMDHALRHAESEDARTWRRDPDPCVARNPGESALARPTVVKDDGLYRMWFACRGAEYRIGYAESADGSTFRRDDERAGIEPGSFPWEDAAVTYPCVFDQAGRRWLLYNGNAYGATGFGIAVEEGA